MQRQWHLTAVSRASQSPAEISQGIHPLLHLANDGGLITQLAAHEELLKVGALAARPDSGACACSKNCHA